LHPDNGWPGEQRPPATSYVLAAQAATSTSSAVSIASRSRISRRCWAVRSPSTLRSVKAARRAVERWGVLLDPSETLPAVGETEAVEARPEAVS
jgi:hypothetical protein